MGTDSGLCVEIQHPGNRVQEKRKRNFKHETSVFPHSYIYRLENWYHGDLKTLCKSLAILGLQNILDIADISWKLQSTGESS